METHSKMDIDSIILKYCKELLSFDSFSGRKEKVEMQDVIDAAGIDAIKHLPRISKKEVNYYENLGGITKMYEEKIKGNLLYLHENYDDNGIFDDTGRSPKDYAKRDFEVIERYVAAREEKIKEEIQKKITPDFVERMSKELLDSFRGDLDLNGCYELNKNIQA